jgi:DNA-directed RNA polymerase sigma subunit (sigma70/sigma32)
VARAELVLENRLGRPPTIEEIAEETAVAIDTVVLLRDVCQEPTSLDRTVGDDDTMTLGELIAA